VESLCCTSETNVTWCVSCTSKKVGKKESAHHLCAPRTQVFQWSLEKVAVDELSKQGYFIAVSDPYAVAFELKVTRKDIAGELLDQCFNPLFKGFLFFFIGNQL